MTMNKRVEKNKRIYEYVNNEIAKKAKAHSNDAFKKASKPLKSINPELFGEDTSSVKQVKKTSSNKKSLVIASIIFSAFVIVIFMIVMVIYLWLKAN